MGDTNKQTKAVSLDPAVVEYVHGLVDKNNSTFTAEVEKSLKMRKADEEKKAYSYSTELEELPLSSLKGRSQGFWIRECAILLAKILEHLQEQSIREA